MSDERTVDKYIDRIVNADCMDVMDDMPDECIDLTVTSPPLRQPEDIWGHA